MKLIYALGNPEPEFSHTRHNIGKDVLNQFVQLYFSDYNWEFKRKFNSDLIFTSKQTGNKFLSGIQSFFGINKTDNVQSTADFSKKEILGDSQQLSHTATNDDPQLSSAMHQPRTNSNLHLSDAIFVKPACYMNEIGIPLQKIVTFYKIKPQDILIIYDELDLVAGEYKLSQGKGSKIHNGVRSVNSSLKNSEKIWHLRVGVRDEKIGQSVQKSGRDPKKYVLAKLPISDRKKIEKLVEESISKDLLNWLSKKD